MKVRTWDNRGGDDGSVHAMGNGSMVAYASGPDLINLYGPPYSSPNILCIHTKCDKPLCDEATREPGAAIWNHRMLIDDSPSLEFTEFVSSSVSAYVRLLDCKSPGVSWRIRPAHGEVFKPSASVRGVWQQIIRPGGRIFGYPCTLWHYHWVIAQGRCSIEPGEKGELIVACQPGTGSLVIVGASDYPAGMKDVEHILRHGAESLLSPTREFWQKFTTRRTANAADTAGFLQDIKDLLDSVAVLIKAQQSKEGGLMAGHHYPMAYIRDQYGAARGMLALGMKSEVKRILDFLWSKFRYFNSLQTADLMGTDCARHVHEYDEVEGPSYVILLARDFLERGGDPQFVRCLWPMLKWCWNVQLPFLSDGTLPFNGDETYVAGGFFPRSGLIQGSADSTLAFIEARRWLAEFGLYYGYIDEERADEIRRQVKESFEAYRKVFFDSDRIWANYPERSRESLPRFRYGLCEGQCGWFGACEKIRNDRYLCPNCMRTTKLPFEKVERTEVNSVSLLPAYLGSDVLSAEEIRAVLDHILLHADENGHIPSVPGNGGCVGYDLGLLLIALDSVRSTAAEEACERLLKLADSASAWNEYYLDNESVRQGCCRARPWESGINAAALINHLIPKG